MTEHIQIRSEVFKTLNPTLDVVSHYKLATFRSNEHDTDPKCFKRRSQLGDCLTN